MNKFIALVGMTGSGKSDIADELVKKGYQFFRFGQITLDIVKDKGLKPTEENEQPIREQVRKEHGMGAYAILNIPKIDTYLKKGDVVGDGLYSWSEYKILKDKYGSQLTVIALYSPPDKRYERLANRKLNKDDSDLRNRPTTIKQSKERDYAEIENIEKGGPIAMADYTLVNTGTKEELISSLKEILKDLK